MSLTPEQKQAVADWVTAGDNLSQVQKKLSEQFKLSLTYRDVRFLVDDLELELKDPAPKADTSDITKAQVQKPAGGAVPPSRTGQAPVGGAPAPREELPDDDALPSAENFPADEGVPAADPAAPATGTLSVEVDRIVRPGAVVSGSVTFSDGVTGKWALDQMGRLMLDTSQKGYRPSPTDVQAFQQELQTQLQRQGF